jgi:hypothetical protein
VRQASATARAAGVAVEKRSEKAWKGAVAGSGKAWTSAVSRSKQALARVTPNRTRNS